MKRMTALLAAVGALLLVYASGVLAQPETPTQKIPDRYIVVFEDGVQRPAALANEHARAYGLQMRFVYTSAIEGYAAVFPNDRALRRVQSDPRVAYVEQDQVVRANSPDAPLGYKSDRRRRKFDTGWKRLGSSYRRQRLHYRHRRLQQPFPTSTWWATSTSEATARTLTATDTERMWPAPWPPKMTASYVVGAAPGAP